MKKATYNFGLKKINAYYNDLKVDYEKSIFNVEIVNDQWWIKEHCTHTFWTKFKEGKISQEELIGHCKKRRFAQIEKDRALSIERLNNMAAAAEVKEVEINVYWTKSRTWGANPRAEVYVRTTEGTEKFESSSIGGCGYDKRSAATAVALNESSSILAALLDLARKEANKGEKTYGYYDFKLPYFEGGVGFSCHRNILEKIGLKAEVLNERAKNYDFYSFKKKGAK